MKKYTDPKAQTVALWAAQVKNETIHISDEWREALRELNGEIAKHFVRRGKTCA